MKELIYPIDLSTTRQRQDRAQHTYDEAAVVQREATSRLLERLEYMLIQPQNILELCIQTPFCSQQLQQQFPNATNSTIKLASCYDPLTYILRLPFAHASQNLVIANLILHWYVDPKQLLSEIRRVLHPDGVLLLSTMGPDTLRELRTAFAKVDTHQHVHDFLDMHDIGDLMQELGFADPVVDMHTLRVKYSDVMDLLKDLRHLGATNAHLDRQRGLMGKQKWQQMLQTYGEINQAEGVHASFELIFGLAWGVRQISHDGEVSIPLQSIKK